MTDAKADLFAKCDELAETFATRARKNDEQASFPVENYADMRAAGLMGMMVPESHGGMGADFYDYTRAAGKLAQGDGATAVTFNMHNIITATLAEVDESVLVGRIGKLMADFRNWVFEGSNPPGAGWPPAAPSPAGDGCPPARRSQRGRG